MSYYSDRVGFFPLAIQENIRRYLVTRGFLSTRSTELETQPYQFFIFSVTYKYHALKIMKKAESEWIQCSL